MYIHRMNYRSVEQALNLYVVCFQNDPYMLKHHIDVSSMKPVIQWCLLGDHCFGVYLNQRLIGMVIGRDYQNFKRNLAIRPLVFRDDAPYWNGNPYYELAICVDPQYRGRHLAGKLIDRLIIDLGDRPIVTDVDNVVSLKLHQDRGFKFEQLRPNYYVGGRNP